MIPEIAKMGVKEEKIGEKQEKRVEKQEKMGDIFNHE